MSYNTDGASFGGFPMPFPIPFFGGGNSNNDSMNGPFGLLMAILFFALFGWGGGMGGMLPGRGMPLPMGGMMACGGGAAAGNIAAETASFVNAQNTADRVASIATGVDAVAGIATANGVKLESVKDSVTNGFFASQTNLCELGNNISQQFNAAAMNGMQNYNGLTNQLSDMRFAQQQCCCDTKQLIQSSFCDLRHQMQVDKCETLGAIAASKAEILGAMAAQKMAELEAKNLELKGQISQSNQTAAIIAAINAKTTT